MHVVVVGAGILGASTAYHLAGLGAQVTLVDQAHTGRATAAGAGIVCPWASGTDDPVFYRLYVEAARYYASLIPELADLGEADIGFRKVGGLVVADDAAELRGFVEMLRRREADTPEMGPVSLLTPRESRELFPPLRADFAAIHIAGGGRVDGRRIASALTRAAARRGASLRDGHAELVATGDNISGVRVAGQIIGADRVVVTAGAWAPEILRRHGVALTIEPQRGQIVHLGLPGQDTSTWPVVLPPGSHYLLAFDDSRVVVGATRESGVGFDNRVTAGGQAQVLSEALRVAPGLADATLIETRIGFRPIGPGVRPLLGYVGPAGLLVGNGLGAAGLTIGPFAGSLLADLALGVTPAVDLAPFDPARAGGQAREYGSRPVRAEPLR